MASFTRSIGDFSVHHPSLFVRVSILVHPSCAVAGEKIDSLKEHTKGVLESLPADSRHVVILRTHNERKELLVLRHSIPSKPLFEMDGTPIFNVRCAFFLFPTHRVQKMRERASCLLQWETPTSFEERSPPLSSSLSSTSSFVVMEGRKCLCSSAVMSWRQFGATVTNTNSGRSIASLRD